MAMLNLLFAYDRRCFNSNLLSKFYFKTSTNVEFSNIVYPTNKIKLKMSLVIIFLIFAGIFSKYRNSNEEIKFYHTFRNLKPDIMAHRGSTKNSFENNISFELNLDSIFSFVSI